MCGGLQQPREVPADEYWRKRAELQGINGKLYDHLQVLLWVAKDNGGEGRNGIGSRALDGCLEIVGHPDSNEMILAKNIDIGGVNELVEEAVQLRSRKAKLVGSLEKDALLLRKKCASYESSHRTLGTLKFFTGTLAVVAIVGGLIFLRLR
jgi:hypothetical protein